jgi:hypothetical protein
VGKLGVSEGCNIVFDSSEYDPEKIDTTIETYSLSMFSQYLSSDINNELETKQICPPFNTFSFDWDPNSKEVMKMDCSLLELSMNKSVACEMDQLQQSMQSLSLKCSNPLTSSLINDQPQILPSFLDAVNDDDDDFEGDDEVNDYEGIYEHFGGGMVDVQYQGEGTHENVALMPSGGHRSSNGAVVLEGGDAPRNFLDVMLEAPSAGMKPSELSRILIDNSDGYSYYSEQSMMKSGSWAGPEYWRFKPSSKGTLIII